MIGPRTIIRIFHQMTLDRKVSYLLKRKSSSRQNEDYKEMINCSDHSILEMFHYYFSSKYTKTFPKL